MATLLLVAFNAAYCYAHGWLLENPISGRLAWSWGLKSVLGWLLAAWALAWAALRWHRWRGAARRTLVWGTAVLLPAWLLMAEWGLGWVAATWGALPEATPFGWLAYQRGPLLMVAALAVGVAAHLVGRSTAGAKLGWSGYPQRIEVRTGAGRAVVALADVERFESYENYSRVCMFDGRSYLLRTTMRQLEGSLPPGRFVRVHRQMIINRSHLVECRGAAGLRLASGTSVRIGRRYRKTAASLWSEFPARAD